MDLRFAPDKNVIRLLAVRKRQIVCTPAEWSQSPTRFIAPFFLPRCFSHFRLKPALPNQSHPRQRSSHATSASAPNSAPNHPPLFPVPRVAPAVHIARNQSPAGKFRPSAVIATPPSPPLATSHPSLAGVLNDTHKTERRCEVVSQIKIFVSVS